ncbi:MAG TPA: carbamoyltransferase HypF, partial [bacterium]|nr:carbamoyltransferase HypF [bacterium]
MEKTAEIVLTGSLQAAGFIPFIYRAAARHKIKGRLSSGPFSVYIQATAPEMSIKSFYEELLANNPAPGLILFGKIDFSPSKKRFESFEISISDKAGLFDFPAPDAAPCEKCVSEMKDKNDRRAAHVFISCSLCGPRYSITERMPFRRENTPYGKLVMCTACSRETKNIKNRRYLSAINSCPQCGPSLYFKGEQTGLVEGDAALKAAKGVLKQGALLAVKGAGCFYIIADAGNDDAVSELRKRKKSEKKPFAVMAESIAVVREFAEAGSREEGFLKGRGAPVVILPKKEGQNLVSDRAAPGLYTVGAALPQSPLFALLFDEEIRAVVFTSGNMEGQPPEYINESAWLALGGIADFFLFSSIEISGPLEDSVVKPYETGCLMLRRSRGDVPVLLNLGKTMKHDVIGAGVRGDGSFCLVSGRYALVSGNHGYRDTPAAAKAYASDLKRLSGLSGFKPAYIAAGHEDGEGEGLLENACAAAPDARRIRIKNFYAQFLSALAENNYYGTAIGMIL